MTVLRTVGFKLLHLLPVLFLVTISMVALSDLLPGSPAITVLGEGATPEQIDRVNQEYGFLDPIWVRYTNWLFGAFQGDFGNSLVTSRPVFTEIAARLPVTLELAILTIGLSLLIATPLAILAAAREGGRFDKIMTALSSGSMSIPSFVGAVVLVYIFAVQMHLVPVSGYAPLGHGIGNNLRYMILPVATMSILEIGFFFRILRGDMATTLREDFVLSARSKGLGSTYVLLRHALRPSLFSLMTLVGLSFGRALGGSVIVETFFGIPGLGQLLVNSVSASDLPVIQAAVVLIAVIYVVVNTGVDVLYSVVDPRIKVK